MIAGIILAAALTTEQVGICADMGELASTTMELRQLGAPRSAFASAILENGSDLPLFAGMLDQAYTEPRRFTEASRARAVEDFRDRWEAVCFEMFEELDQ